VIKLKRKKGKIKKVKKTKRMLIKRKINPIINPKRKHKEL